MTVFDKFVDEIGCDTGDVRTSIVLMETHSLAGEASGSSISNGCQAKAKDYIRKIGNYTITPCKKMYCPKRLPAPSIVPICN